MRLGGSVGFLEFLATCLSSNMSILGMLEPLMAVYRVNDP
jgi:hypothetical protein